MVITYKPISNVADIAQFMQNISYKGCSQFSMQYNPTTTNYTITAHFVKEAIDNYYLPALCPWQNVMLIDSIVFNK